MQNISSNRSKIIAGGSLVCGLLFAGCATSNRTALAPTAASQMISVTATATVTQPEIAADIELSNVSVYTGGGLIGALVDSAIDAKRSKKAEGEITPLRDAMTGFDTAETLRAELAKKMVGGATIPVKAVTVEMMMKPDAMRKHVGAGTADAEMFIFVDYRLTPNFSRLHVHATAMLISKKSPDEKPLYKNTFDLYRSAPPSERPTMIGKWADNHAAAARQALQDCFAELADMVVYDLQQGAEANMPAKETLNTSAPAVSVPASMAQRVTVRGVAIKRQDGRTWVRLATGELSADE
jgi:hypothetical protein